MAGILVFNDRLTRLNTVGLCVVVLGVAGYNYHKYKKVSHFPGNGVLLK
jgi:threonine/homoserine efflux transporter RhtA